MNAQLFEDYKKGKILLFVGAGVSANLGLPTWGKLINRLASELGYDPDVFKTYVISKFKTIKFRQSKSISFLSFPY